MNSIIVFKSLLVAIFSLSTEEFLKFRRLAKQGFNFTLSVGVTAKGLDLEYEKMLKI